MESPKNIVSLEKDAERLVKNLEELSDSITAFKTARDDMHASAGNLGDLAKEATDAVVTLRKFISEIRKLDVNKMMARLNVLIILVSVGVIFGGAALVLRLFYR